MSNLVKTNRFPSLGSMMEDFWNTDKFFNQPFFNGETLPAVNIRETKNNYELEVAAPGFKKEDFKVTTENGLLTISAETATEKNEEKEKYTRREFSCSSFIRTFTLPENVVEDDIVAKYRDGLLNIELKKSGKNLVAKKEVKVD
ncbi:Hsp20/alpha crystallin family protein [Mucilaginibacter gotjawali]|jgi:HSP20 family protein|uniref:HSP20 family protein n=2 Tax=Mucilaginibacter gotjawali TaxID=1550579 RepID=A0A839SIP3_9SPHI|nr:Hsp20/alpha crystallin family protein [Mucilaginibacter gotjawali]MBB3056377.1 HSP20 family protein [Mucilaginibacter gotjawali]BAU55084.1 Acid shock protein [Mucilaginibacter gotjawali]